MQFYYLNVQNRLLVEIFYDNKISSINMKVFFVVVVLHLRYYSFNFRLRKEEAQLLSLEVISKIPPSRPLTPTEQINIITAIEYDETNATGFPSVQDEEVLFKFICSHIYSLYSVSIFCF